MAQKNAASSDATLNDFEKSLSELENLVDELESGDISLEESLKKFERGVQLARTCQGVLKNAELRVEQLLENNGETTVAPLQE